jgi:hypothetical protein
MLVIKDLIPPTERPQLVDEISGNSACRGLACPAQRIPKSDNLRFLEQSRYFIINGSP